MKQNLPILFLSLMVVLSCNQPVQNSRLRIRKAVDTVGFAHEGRQMDSVMARILDTQMALLSKARSMKGNENIDTWRIAVCPHDDYSYVGYLYPAILENVKAKTIFLIGVAHKAKQLGLEDRIIFESFNRWKSPYGMVRVSSLRQDIISHLPENFYIVSDSMHMIEHSLEALIPYLQFYNNEIEIIPILVPYMSIERMEQIAQLLAYAIKEVAMGYHMTWGKDFAMVISNDAVHYGDDDWGGRNYAPYGADSSGYKQAVDHEKEIMDNCLTGEVNPGKIAHFVRYTVKEDNYKEYKWTWCGRYSVPFGLLTAYHLQ